VSAQNVRLSVRVDSAPSEMNMDSISDFSEIRSVIAGCSAQKNSSLSGCIKGTASPTPWRKTSASHNRLMTFLTGKAHLGICSA
jgi:hypothetical protein